MTDMTPRARTRRRDLSLTQPASILDVHATQPAARPVSVMRISAEADPNILARIIQPMVKLDLMPRALYVLSEDGAEMVVEAVFAASSSGSGQKRAWSTACALRDRTSRRWTCWAD